MTDDQQCIMPTISLVAYEAWPKGKVFVRVPNERGRYVMTDRCVVEVGCPVCKATRGQPCFNPGTKRVWASVHGDRKCIAPLRYSPMRDHPKPIYRYEDVYGSGVEGRDKESKS